MPPFEAAIKGAQEIAFAVVAMTLTLAAVFAPLAFATGNTGKLFTEFALTVAAAVLVSGFVALTLTPMMCSQACCAMKPATARSSTSASACFDGAERGYTRGLTRVVRHPLDRRRWCSCWSAAAAFGLLQIAQVGTGADSRIAASSSASCSRPKAPPCNTPTATRASSRSIYQERAGGQTLLRRGGAGPGAPQPGQHRAVVRAAEALGGTQPQPDGHHRRARPADVHGHAGRARLPDQPALARPELPQPAAAVRGAGAELRRTRQGGRSADGQGARLSGAGQRRQRPQAQQAAARGRHRPRQGGADGRRRRHHRPHAGDPARRARRSPASSARASSTT